MEILQVADEMVILTMDNYKMLIDQANTGNNEFKMLKQAMDALEKENQRIIDGKSIAFIRMKSGFGGDSHKEIDVDRDHDIVKKIIKAL